MTSQLTISPPNATQFSSPRPAPGHFSSSSTSQKTRAVKRRAIDENVTSSRSYKEDDDIDVINTAKLIAERGFYTLKLNTEEKLTKFYESLNHWKVFFKDAKDQSQRSSHSFRDLQEKMNALINEGDETCRLFFDEMSKELFNYQQQFLKGISSVATKILYQLDEAVELDMLRIQLEKSVLDFKTKMAEYEVQNNIREKHTIEVTPSQLDPSHLSKYCDHFVQLCESLSKLYHLRLQAFKIDQCSIILEHIQKATALQLMNREETDSAGSSTDENTYVSNSEACDDDNELDDHSTAGDEDGNLLDQDNNVNLSIPLLITPVTPDIECLVQAIESQNPQKVARVVQQLAPNPNTMLEGTFKNKMWTPLHLAATLGDPDVIEALMLLNPFLDYQDMDGNTPLMIAALKGHCKAISIFFDYGADLSKINDMNQTAKDIADAEPSQKIKLLFEEYERKILEDIH